MGTIDKGIVFADDANKLVFFNRAAEELLNMKPKERIETSIFLIPPKKIEQKVAQRMDQFRKDPRIPKGGILIINSAYPLDTGWLDMLRHAT